MANQTINLVGNLLGMHSAWKTSILFIAVAWVSCVQGATVVGRIPGNFAVSAVGNATYSIPITVAAGQNGLKPDIALVYSSTGPDGLAGLGWALSGLSQIARCELTPVLDGTNQGVRFNKEDRYCLDGQPLLQKSPGNYWDGGQEYRTEIYDYQKIISFETSGSGSGAGPKYFEVRHRNGLIYRYGYNTDSRVKAAGNPDDAIRIWALDEIRDPYNTRIFFSYHNDSSAGTFLPASVKWSARDGSTENDARYQLEFLYENRPEKARRSGYTWGSVWAHEKRLKHIDYAFKMSGSFQRVHRYALQYKSITGGSGRSVLESVQKCGSGASPDCLPATTFDSHVNIEGWLPGAPQGESVSGYLVEYSIPVDFNGDGRQDLLVPKSGNWYVLLGSWGEHIGGVEWSWLQSGFPTGKSAVNPESTRVIDYNGDGLSDLLTPDVTGANWQVYLSDGSVFSNLDINIPKSELSNPVVMDINGDGLDEILYRSNGILWVRINNGSGFDAPVVATNQLNGAGPDITFPGQRADFDGDGRDDYYEYRKCVGEGCSSGESIRIYISNGTGFDFEGEFNTNANQVYRSEIRPVDINGDGLSDLVFSGVGNDGTLSWHTMLSHGDGLEDSVDTTIPFSGDFQTRTPYTFADYNMDGRDDLVVGVKGSGGGWTVYLSDGMTFAEAGISLAGVAEPGSGTVFAMDIGGTGYPSLVFDDYPNGQWLAYSHQGGEGKPGSPDSMTSVADGLGNYFKINSRPVTRVATYSGAATPPLEREFRAGSYYVVDNYESNDGTGSGKYKISYLYTDPKRNMQGRGFLGFSAVRAADSRDGTYSVATYRQDFPFTGRIDRVVRYQSDGKTISSQKSIWDRYEQWAAGDNKHYYFVHLAEAPAIGREIYEYEVDPDGGNNGQLVRATKHRVQYDFFHGKIKQDLKYQASPAHSTLFTTKIDTNYWGYASGPVYCLGFPSQVTVNRSDGIGPDQIRTVRLNYNSNCRLISENVGPASDPGRQLVTAYAIDGEGKVTAITRDSGDGMAADRINIIGWDTIGGYRPTSQTSIASGETSLTVHRTWDYGLSLESSRTDPRGQVTSWQYDDFGRMERETRPGPSTSTITIEQCTQCFPSAAAKYKVRSQRSDGYWSEQYHDSYGRVVGESSVVLSGAGTSETRTALTYNSLGHVVSEKVPYLAGNPSYGIEYLYDLHGRIKRERRPDANPGNPFVERRWTYSLLDVVLTDPVGNITTYRHDALGRLVQTQAPLGSGTFNSYWPDGELKSITQDGVVIKSMTYDDRGFLATMTDIDSGTWKFDFSVFGELLSKTDDVSPFPNTITMEYDQLGRPRQRTEAEGITNWVYHQSGNGLGLLEEVTGPLPSIGHTTGSCTQWLGYCEKYSYDSSGRLQQTIHQINSSNNVTNYEYNDNNQVVSITYPAMLAGNRYTFIYTYTSGHLNTIDQDIGNGLSRTIYNVVNHDAFGNVELSKLFGDFGGGQYEFDHQRLHYPNDGRVLSIKSGYSPLGTSAQNYVYTWGESGDLHSRQDRGQSDLTESFIYDALHRLDKIFLNGVETLDIDYYANGNIDTKSDVGTYHYAGPAGSRAVTSITDGPRPDNYHFDANGNMDCRGGSSSACTHGDSIRWTSFNKPSQINFGNNLSLFSYGPDRRLVLQSRKAGASNNWNIQYVGRHFEKENNGNGKTRWRANVFANGRVVYQIAEHQTKNACSSQQGSQGYFLLRDHQNSIDVLLADGTGGDSQYSFDAFGKRRNTNGWTADTGDVLLYLNQKTKRGYTGHEHLDNLKLVHMKGRVYDPIIGRMISPDPVLGDIDDPQSLNSYSYVLNNPVSLADPSGYSACPADTECITLDGTSGEVNIYVVDFPEGQKGNVARGKDIGGNDAIFFDAGSFRSDLFRLDRAFEGAASQIQSSIDYSNSLNKMNNMSRISQRIENRILHSVIDGHNSEPDFDNQQPVGGATSSAYLRWRWGLFGSFKQDIKQGGLKFQLEIDVFSFHMNGQKSTHMTQGAAFSLEALGQTVVDFGYGRISTSGGSRWSEYKPGVNVFNVGVPDTGGVDYEGSLGLGIGIIYGVPVISPAW